MKNKLLLFLACFMLSACALPASFGRKNMDDRYVVKRICEKPNGVVEIDVKRNHSVYRIHSIIREPIDSTYKELYVGYTFMAELQHIWEMNYKLWEKRNQMPNLGIVLELYPGICVAQTPPKGICGEYICSRFNGKFIKKESYDPLPISLVDFYYPSSNLSSQVDSIK